MSHTTNYLQSESVAAQGPEIIALVNCMVQDAIRLNASDLHIEPWEQAVEVRARVNGVLTEVAHLPLDLLDKISMRFKVMSNLVAYRPACRRTARPSAGRACRGDKRHRLLKSDAPCSPCFLRECPIDFRCLNGISVERVVEAVLSVV